MRPDMCQRMSFEGLDGGETKTEEKNAFFLLSIFNLLKTYIYDR